MVGVEVTAFEGPGSVEDRGVDRAGGAAVTDGVGDPRRLAALAESGLMDGAPEAAFDRVTRLVAEVLHVPVALFTLVTDDRQVFKSSVGVGDVRETPLSHSFCRHVVDSGAPLEVVDARVHPRVRDNPAIEDFGIVAYLGMPLTTKDGTRLGALCAIDHEPRQWTGRDHGVLEDLAGAAMAEIELRRANRAVAAAAAELHFAATHDTLTQLRNRRALLEDLGQLLQEGRPATFALLDVHGMRGYNDAHGHIAGDELLASLANRLEAATGRPRARVPARRRPAVRAADVRSPRRPSVAACVALTAADHAIGCRAVTVDIPREGEEHRGCPTPRRRAAGRLRACCDRWRLTSRSGGPGLGRAAARRRSPASTRPGS